MIKGYNFKYFSYLKYFVLANITSLLFLFTLSLYSIFVNTSSVGYTVLWSAYLLLLGLTLVFSLFLIFYLISQFERPKSLIYVLATVLIIGTYLAFAIYPTISDEVMSKELAIAKFWLENNRAIVDSSFELSYFPSLISFVFIGLIKYKLVYLINNLAVCYIILTAVIISSFIYYKLQNSELAFSAFFLTLTYPIFQEFSSSPCSVIFGLYVFSLMLFLAIYLAEQRLWLAFVSIVSFLNSILISTSYSCHVVSLLFLLIISVFLISLNKFNLKTLGVIFGYLSLSLFLSAHVWYRNYLLTENIFFPFETNFVFADYFSDKLPLASYFDFDSPLMDLGSAFLSLIYLDNFHLGVWRNSLLLLLGLFVSLRYSKQYLAVNWVSSLILFFFSYLLIFVVDMPLQANYFLPLIPVLVVVIVNYFQQFSHEEKTQKNIMNAILSIAMLHFLYAAYIHINEYSLVSFYSDFQRMDLQSIRYVKNEELYKLINKRVKPEEKIFLYVNNPPLYYVNSPSMYFVYPEKFIKNNLIVNPKSKEENFLQSVLKKEKVTYILLDSVYLKDSLGYSLSEKERAEWNEFVGQNLTLVLKKDSYYLWKLN